MESKTGADIFQLQWNHPYLYAEGLEDHNALAEEVAALKTRIFSDAEFMQQADLVFKERGRMLDYALDRYLAGDKRSPIDGEIKALSGKVTKGAQTDAEKARAVFDCTTSTPSTSPSRWIGTPRKDEYTSSPVSGM